MIQRIQTVYFLLALILISIPLFGLPLYVVKLEQLGEMKAIVSALSYQLYEVVEPTVLWVYIALPALAVLLTIFLFKDRKKQATMAKLSIGLVAFSSGWIFYTGMQFFNESTNLKNHGVVPQVAYYCFAASIVFILLGLRGVNKDKKLIDSLNRLR